MQTARFIIHKQNKHSSSHSCSPQYNLVHINWLCLPVAYLISPDFSFISSTSIFASLHLAEPPLPYLLSTHYPITTMSQHDSDSESDGSITASSTSSDENLPGGYVEGRVCHFLGHIEAIPVTREGNLVQVHHAWVRVADRNDHEFSVFSSNPRGPRFNFCYKLPGSGNNWLARTSDNTDATTELFVHVQKQGIKGHKIHVYQCVHHAQSSSWIIESYPKEKKTKRIPQDEALAWSLQQRLHFEIGDTFGRHPWNRPSRYNQRGREVLSMDEDEVADEDERMDAGEDLEEDEDEESDDEEDEESDDQEDDDDDGDDDEESDGEDEDDDEDGDEDDEESVPTFGAIWASRA